MKIERILESVTNGSLYFMALMVPWFFLPITSEWFEWNKYYLLLMLASVGVLSWLGQVMVSKKFTLARYPFELPLLAFWAITLIATILSKNRLLSFLGLPENVSGGFITLTLFVVVTLLITWTIRSEDRLRRFMNLFAIGVGVSIVYYWIAHFKILSSFASYFPQMNPVSQLNAPFGVLIAVVAVLGLGMLLLPELNKSSNILWGIITAMSFITAVAIGFNVIWIALALGCFFLLVFSVPRMSEVRYPVLSLTMVAFVIALVFLVIGTPRFLTVSNPTEITLSQGTSLQISTDTLKEGVTRFLFGSGPSTFRYDFSDHRARSFNLSPVWTVRFASPGASSLQILSETGILGALAFLVLLASVILAIVSGLMRRGGLGKGRRRMTPDTEMGDPALVGVFFALSAAWITTAVLLFFSTYGMVLWFVFFALMALIGVVGNLAGFIPEKTNTVSSRPTPIYSLATSFSYIVVIALIVVGGVTLGRKYGADVLVMKAARAASIQKYDQAENLLGQAINLNAKQPRYDILLANTYIKHAASESRQTKPDSQKIGQLVGNAITAARLGTSIDPLSVETWEQAVGMYKAARPFAKDGNTWVISSLNEALKRETTNAQFYLERSIAEQIDERWDAAEVDAKKAIELKANYAQAYYTYSIILEHKKDLSGAIDSAKLAVKFAPKALDAQFNVARLYYNRNQDTDWATAEAVFRQILSVNKNYGNAVFSLGILLERQGKNADALVQYRQAEQLDPKNKAISDRIKNLGATPKNVAPEPTVLPDESTR